MLDIFLFVNGGRAFSLVQKIANIAPLQWKEIRLAAVSKKGFTSSEKISLVIPAQ
jgi:hypothetical protein